MATGFRGFSPDALKFFRALERNNCREWFQPRKQEFETLVRAPAIEMVNALNALLARKAPDYITEPDRAIYRIYRDTRFSNDKTPYKTHIGATFTCRGIEKHAGAGLYFSVNHKEIEVAGGIYMPGPEQLLAVRSHLALRHTDFRKLIAGRKLRRLVGELQGDQLARVPKGFTADHEAADLIRYKQWLFYTILDPALAASPQLFPEIAERFIAMLPVVEFLNAPLKAARRKDALSDSFYL